MLKSSRCNFSELVFDYLDATIDDQSAATFEAHLSDCPDCLALLRENAVEPNSEAWLTLLQNPFPVVDLHNSESSAPPIAGLGQVPAIWLDAARNRSRAPLGDSQGPPVSGLRYTCTRHLGSGGSGEVWEAWDQLLGRPVALKFLRNTVAPLSETHRLMQEATALARLSHPRIVSIHELQNFSGLPVLVMELVPGPSLARYLRGRPCTPTAAVVFIEQLCQAVEHAHSVGVVHRDLKPSNVLLTPAPDTAPATDDSSPQLGNWCPKIADFGLAHITDQPSLTLPGQRVGTPSYMAPEQVSASAEKCGPGTDIYGLGAILYELLTGRPPFASSDPALTMAMILRDEPVSPRSLAHGITRDLETVCLKCLRKEPRSRYRDAAALRKDCLAILHNRPISARPVSRPRRCLAWARRHPAESTALFASFALLVTVTAASLRNAQLSEKLSAEAQQKIRLLEETQSLQQQKQESVRSKFDELLQAHHHFLQMLGDARRPQPVDPEAMRSEVLQSAAQLATPYIELLDQKIEAGQQPTPMEVRLAVDYLDLAFSAGASVDFATRLPGLDKLIKNLAPHTAPPRELLEIKLRLESLNARLAVHMGQHIESGQFHLNMAALIDQQLLTFSPDDPARVERLQVKTAMLLNAITAYIAGNRDDLALIAATLAEDTIVQLLNTDPDNQNWLAMLLQVRLRRSQFLPQAEAVKLASDTLEQFKNIRWDSPENAEAAQQIQLQLQARAQVANP